MHREAPLAAVVIAAIIAGGCGPLGAAGRPDAGGGDAGTDGGIGDGGISSDLSGLHVSGGHLVNGQGQRVRLVGADRSGSEYACVQGWGIFDGPADTASVQAMKAWGINAVRVPLNEDCWLNINSVNPAYAGANYQSAIAGFVSTLNAAGMVAILDLHWTAPGAQQATGQNPMPDSDHSVAFWSDVAQAYKANAMVVFDVFNEPYPDSNQDTTAAWTCWLSGGTCSGVSYTVAGMQELVTAIRSAGASNVAMLGGVEYSNALTQWLQYMPSDPTGNLAASWHVYDFNLCSNTSCYDASGGPVAQQVPIIAGEIGSSSCDSAFLGTLMGWLDSHEQSYLAWTWDTWGTSCSSLSLISDYSGTPTQNGQIYKSHIATVPH